GPGLIQMLDRAGFIFARGNLNSQITENVNHQAQQNSIGGASDQPDADPQPFVQPFPAQPMIIVRAVLVVETDLPMDEEPYDDENNRNEEKNDDRRQENAPNRVLQSHQGNQRFDDRSERYGQKHAQPQAQQREDHPNCSFSITQRAEKGKQYHGHK